jgi:hypothetical protein
VTAADEPQLDVCDCTKELGLQPCGANLHVHCVLQTFVVSSVLLDDGDASPFLLQVSLSDDELEYASAGRVSSSSGRPPARRARASNSGGGRKVRCSRMYDAFGQWTCLPAHCENCRCVGGARHGSAWGHLVWAVWLWGHCTGLPAVRAVTLPIRGILHALDGPVVLTPCQNY